MDRMKVLKSISLGVGLLTLLVGATQAQTYWNQQQCLNAAQICRESCKRQTQSGFANCRAQNARQSCFDGVNERNRECIYVTCDTDPCFKLSN
jgi:hypothetical protein